MPNLGLEIKRKCRICGKVFIIKMLDSLYCCKKCSDVAYARKKRAETREKQLALITDQVLYEAARICREIPEAEAMAEDTFIDDRNFLRFNDVLDRGRRVFLAGLDGATGVVQVSGGGGGTSNDMPWRDKDEDFLHFAHRVMLYAHAKCYPGSRHKRTQNR